MTATHGDFEGLHEEVRFLWHIPDYFSNKEIDSYYNSPAFHFLGSTWSIRIYPNGQREHHSVGYVGFHIRQEEKYKENDVCFRIGILYPNGQCLESKGYTSNGIHYTKWHKFTSSIKLSLNRSLIAPKGTLTIRLVGTPSRGKTILHKESQTKILDGMNVLSRDFQALLSCDEQADVTIRVKSRVFRAHKLILAARSTVFAAMFRHDMKEKATGSIDIEDCEPSAFQEFLTFMYTGRADILSSKNVCDILFLANKYDLNDLKEICINFIQDNLCLDMVCNVLCVADTFDLVDLKKAATELFRKNRTSVMVTENWLSFVRENPKLASEILLEAFP